MPPAVEALDCQGSPSVFLFGKEDIGVGIVVEFDEIKYVNHSYSDYNINK